MKTHYIAIPLMAALLLVGCKQNAAGEAAGPDSLQGAAMPEATAPEATMEPQEAEPVELVPVIQTAKPAQKRVATTAQPAPKTTPKPTVQPALKGTIYVETEGAQGRVWGHVTMNGDRGTGTIHDWDENTWAVSVTRHGDELFAVDQNSRLYVFKLKQSKKQE